MFKWLVLHNRIITWEDLRKRGYIGPSRFHLYQYNEETTNHLLHEFSYTRELWDWATGIYRHSNRIRVHINATINNWKESYIENEKVNLCWNLMPGMIIWKYGRRGIDTSSGMKAYQRYSSRMQLSHKYEKQC
jgi:hypothetical protein